MVIVKIKQYIEMKFSHQKGKKPKEYIFSHLLSLSFFTVPTFPLKETLSPYIIFLYGLATAASSVERRLTAPRHSSPYTCLF